MQCQFCDVASTCGNHSKRKFDEHRQLTTWHEVSILKDSEVAFEYANCKPETGMTVSTPLRQSPLQENKSAPVRSAQG